jgi:hypothetical protein
MSIALLTLFNTVYAQSYTITSFEGTPVKVNLSHRLDSTKLSVSILTDSILIPYFDKVINVQVLKGNFLEIVWRGPEFRHSADTVTTVLSVSKNKIDVSAYFLSFVNWFRPRMGDLPYQKIRYTATSMLTGTDKSNYKLHVDVIDRVNSRPYAKDDHNRNLHLILTFDPVQNIFFSSRKNIDQVFTFDRSTKQHVKGLLPILVLGACTNYYYNGKWYLVVGDELTKLY